MSRRGVRLGDHIEALARRTDAPSSYVEKVRSLFTARGVSMDEDAAPYREALDEVFLRQQAIRRIVAEAMANKVQLERDLSAQGTTCTEQLGRLSQLLVLWDVSERVKGSRRRREAPRDLSPGERDLSIVPGPDTPQ